MVYRRAHPHPRRSEAPAEVVVSDGWPKISMREKDGGGDMRRQQHRERRPATAMAAVIEVTFRLGFRLIRVQSNVVKIGRQWLALVQVTRSKGQLRVIRVLLRCGLCYGSGQRSRLVNWLMGSGQPTSSARLRFGQTTRFS
ncbi:uncharacterized protein LOC118492276 [Helianthus annuus]|uniref:uncharacterized protein LOC118492276 n=1 Tax=Helianthus annuus TaxID=4232 RepID=UPI0016530AC5|nr:uncharacterized protein LOC118492276 [Helianthus annuus]